MTRHPSASLTAWTASPLFLWEGAGQALAAHLASVQGDGHDHQLGNVLQRLAASIGLSAGETERKPPPKSLAPTFLTNPTRHDGGFFVADRIAYITINGPLERTEGWYGVGYDGITRRAEAAFADPMIDGVFASIDSPGGHAVGMLECAGKLRGFADESGKPFVAHAPALVASAAYGLGVAADRLTIDPDAMCGSVGVVLLHADISKMLESWGVKLTAIQFGEKKTDGNFWEPLSDRARADLEQMIDDMGARFVPHVAGRRGLSEQVVIDWQAGVLVGQRAIDASMADGLATEEEAFAALLAEINPTLTSAPQPQTATTSPSAPSQATTTESSEPAGAGAPSRAPSTTTLQTQQRKADMTLKADLTAVLEGDGTAEEKLASATAILTATEDPDPDAEDDADDAALDEADDADAEDTDEGDEADASADAEEDDDKPDATTAGAIVTLPEAKGREKQAVKLAGTPGMTVKAAKALLADAPKEKASGGLAARMEGQDPNIAAGSGDTGANDNPLVAVATSRRASARR
jgi:ClpP class serine protease